MFAGADLGHANPTGGTVQHGTATFNTSGSQLTITTSSQAFINWQSFNIAPGETTTFVQPSSSSLVWNEINDPNPSQILGNLNANGYVVLQNQNGFYIGGQAAITAHGLIMTTSPLPMPDLSSSGPWTFGALPPTAKIINYGQINVGNGSAFLIADDIENNGTISAQGGNIGLYAGEQVLVSTRPDGRGLSASVTLPQGSVDNSGKLIADGGSIAIQAQVVNQGGLVQANSIANVNGVIELVASDSLNLGAGSTISATGDTTAASPSPGGFVVLKSGNSFSDTSTSTIDVSGAQGGQGGLVELFGNGVSQNTVLSAINNPYAVLYNPYDLTLSLDPTAAASSILNVNDLANYGQIDLWADDNITLGSLWSLADPGGPANLNLTAGNDIIFNNNSGISAGNNWSVNLSAGPQNLTAKPTTARTDGIYLDGNSYVQTANGDINIWAANEVLINADTATAAGNGIRTTKGGNIDVTTQWGDVNTGGNTAGYVYSASAPYYSAAYNVGGISTETGGNVTITAGGNITSYSPSGTGLASGSPAVSDGGTGAFGPQAGNVTLNAGGNIYGHYVVGNGTGTVTAGGDVGAAIGNPFALSLSTGSWTVNAPNGNIYLQEVRNPNGIFNYKIAFGKNAANSPGNHLFTYGPQSSVTLDAGHGVYLTGTESSVPRLAGASIPILYPGTLNITAGDGGVTLDGSLVLFPSSFGNLNITTTDGGNLTGTATAAGTSELLMSDSSQTRWLSSLNPGGYLISGTFGDADHGSTLAELNNPNPVLLNISGSMENLTLLTTKETQINIGGDMINANFSGQNLHPSDITSIKVGGQILYSSPLTFQGLSAAIPALPTDALPSGLLNNWDSIFRLLMDPQAIANLVIPANTLPSQLQDLAQSAAVFPTFGSQFQTGNPGFVYSPTHTKADPYGQIGFLGPMPAGVLAAFSQPLTVLVYQNGIPETTTQNGVTHFVTQTVNWAAAADVAMLYHDSQSAPPNSTPQYGLRVGGPGAFDVSASSISLGNSYGIFTAGANDPDTIFSGRYGNLAAVTPTGANLNVTVSGDLSMITSAIASLAGGDVNVSSIGGSMDLGTEQSFGVPRPIGLGIYATGPGADVNVIAQGNVNVDGSRIAAFDGGDVFVKSLQGDVNAGTGGATLVQVSTSFVNPQTGQGGNYVEDVYGSGIIAYTLVNPSQVPGAPVTPGNIMVETPHGGIYANQGGILQEALNGNVSAGPTITLSAGSPGDTENIDLGSSGVIGGTVNATATGNITGLIISRQNSDINAAGTFSGTVLSGGSASLNAGTVSATSTIIGVGGVSVAGTIDSGAQVLGQNVSVNGGAATSTLGTSAAASTAATSASGTANDDAQKQVASNDDSQDDNKKKKGKGPALTRKVGRVTVLLPAKS